MCHFFSKVYSDDVALLNSTEQIGTNLFNFIFDELSMNYFKEQFS